MKKLTNYLFIALALVSMVFTSCEGDETDKSPSLTLKGGSDYISSDATLTAGQMFMVGVTALPNESSTAKLTNFSVTRTFNNVPATVIDSTLDKVNSFTTDIIFYAQPTVGTERIVFEITDKDGEITEQVLNITTEEGALDLNEYSAVLMGAQSSSEGSTASLTSGVVYKISGDEAKTNSIDVDVVYYFGAKDAAIYAPSNADIQGVTAYGISGWATKNATKLSATSMTASDFNGIATDKDLETAGSPTDDVVGLLAVDDVVVFETADGKKGVFKVSEVNAGASGSIKIDIKIEQ